MPRSPASAALPKLVTTNTIHHRMCVRLFACIMCAFSYGCAALVGCSSHQRQITLSESDYRRYRVCSLSHWERGRVRTPPSVEGIKPGSGVEVEQEDGPAYVDTQ